MDVRTLGLTPDFTGHQAATTVMTARPSTRRRVMCLSPMTDGGFSFRRTLPENFGIILGALMAVLLKVNAAEPTAKPSESTKPPEAEIKLQTSTYSLEDFGDIDTIANAQQALGKAIELIKGKGGGVLVIPAHAPEGLMISNKSQSKPNTPFVNIVDYRGGGQVEHLAPLGSIYTPTGMASPRSFRRLVTEPLPWHGVYSSLNNLNHYVHGPSSYMRKLTRPVKKGPNAKWHVESIVGAFVGQNLKVTGQGFGYQPPFSDIVVKEIGWDAEARENYIVADAPNDHPSESIIYNKNVVNALTIEDISPSDNQSMSLIVKKVQYGQGDSFGISSSVHYQGNVMSGWGDEGGVAGNFEIIHDIIPFRGVVEGRPDAQRVIYKKESATHTEKLATSRPLINLNEKKWIREGKVRVYINEPPNYPDKKGPRVVGIKTRWTKEIVGRYFALDDPNERINPKDPEGGGYAPNPGHVLHRWWLIRSMEDSEKDGTQHLFIERTRWGVGLANPSLMAGKNFVEYGGREISYIIAPGANVVDVSTANPIGQALDRTVRVVPNGDYDTRFDFELGDPIEQAVGPDPWAPTGVRVRHFNRFPSTIEDASFMGVNWGTVPVWAGLALTGPSSTEDVRNMYKSDGWAYTYGIKVMAPTQTAIAFSSDVENAALWFEQPHGRSQPIWWNFEKGRASLTVAPKDGMFRFVGGGIYLSEQDIRATIGISGSETPAQNLRGINVAVPPRTTSFDVRFDRPEPDETYAVAVELGWLATKAITRKNKNGFTLQFDKPAPPSAKLDWILIR